MGILGDKFKTKSHEVCRGLVDKFKHKVYEVRGTEGEWEDRIDWSEGAMFSKVRAQQACDLLNKEVDAEEDNYNNTHYYIVTISVI